MKPKILRNSNPIRFNIAPDDDPVLGNTEAGLEGVEVGVSTVGCDCVSAFFVPRR